MRNFPIVLGVMLAAAGGCVAPPPPPPPPAPAPVAAAAPVPIPELAWTGRPDVQLHSEGREGALVARPFTRLEVLDGDSLRLLVHCAVCGDSVSGWIERSDVVTEAASPDSAAAGDLVEFALAVRRAAEERRADALVPVMAPDFAFALIGTQSLAAALRAWEWEGYRPLEEVPALLDRGLARIGPGFWVAPPEHAEQAGYRGPRLGFRLSASGRWQWLFLLRGEG